MDPQIDLYWLAGLLEGEGSFLAGPPSSPHCPRIQLPMTDQDVVARAARLLDRPVWRSDRGVELGYKPAFLTSIKGAAAARLMTVLRPVMGKRRQSQIDRALARPYRPTIRWLRPARACSAAPCPRPVRTKGLCKTHYHAWWKATKRGRPSRYTPIEAPAPAGVDALELLAPPVLGTALAVAWLAGLLEGEGSFEAYRQEALVYPRISVQMTDEDVVHRVAQLLGSRSVWRAEPRQEGWSPTYSTAITGARAADHMTTLLPLMGERRILEMQRALDLYHPVRVFSATCAVAGCDCPHDSRGLCHRHHMHWWRDTRSGRAPRVTPLR